MGKKISILVPTFNEEQYLAQTLDSLLDDYVCREAEILVVDGQSTDRTVEIARDYTTRQFPVRVINNPQGLQCYGLNLGIAESEGEYIVRVDAHSSYPQGYVRKLVELLETTGAANVGGIMLPVGHTPVQEAIALAMQHPVGVGNAKFHLGNYRGYVDTVYLGAFRKADLLAAGLYDTRCRTNEDAELNIRLLKAGKKIYLDSAIAVSYLPRDTFGKLARQYFRYGEGRAYTSSKHRLFTSYRQVAPPLLVLALLLTLVLGMFAPLFLGLWAGYALSLLVTACCTWRSRFLGIRTRLLLALAFAIMHLAWGLGFLSFFLKKPFHNPINHPNTTPPRPNPS